MQQLLWKYIFYHSWIKSIFLVFSTLLIFCIIGLNVSFPCSLVSICFHWVVNVELCGLAFPNPILKRNQFCVARKFVVCIVIIFMVQPPVLVTHLWSNQCQVSVFVMIFTVLFSFLTCSKPEHGASYKRLQETFIRKAEVLFVLTLMP